MSEFAPIFQSRPSALSRLENKRRLFDQLEGEVGEGTGNAISLFDQRRIQNGGQPISDLDSVRGALAIQSNQATTEEAKRSISPSGLVGGFLDNIKTIGRAVPQLPGFLVNEVRDLGQLPQAISQASADSGGNPLRFLGEVAEAPGARLLPGAFVADELFSEDGQGASELFRNPLFTALDVAPGVGGLARRSRVARRVGEAGERAYQSQLAAVDAGTSTITPSPPRRPGLGTTLTRRIDEAGDIVPSRLGNVTGRIGEAFRDTRIGGELRSTFSSEARDVAQIEASVTRQMFQDPSDSLRLSIEDLNARHDISPELAGEIHRAATLDRNLVPEEHLAYVLEAEEIANRILHETQVNELFGSNAPQTVRIGGVDEVLTPRQARVIRGRQRQVEVQETIGDIRSNLGQRSSPDKLARRIEAVDEVRARQELKSVRKDATEAVVRDLQARGFDVDDLLRRLDDPDLVLSAEMLERSKVFRPGTADRFHVDLEPLGRIDPLAKRFNDAMREGRWGTARKALRDISKRTNSPLPKDLDLPGALSELKARQAGKKYLSRTEAQYSERALARARKKLAGSEARATPARFFPKIEENLAKKGEDLTREMFGDDPVALAQYLDQSRAGVFSHLDQKTWEATKKDMLQSWQELRATGVDPVYSARLPTTQASKLTSPSVVPKPAGSLRAAGQRTLDFTPHFEDFSLSLLGSHFDVLQKIGSQAFFDEVGRTFGKSQQQIVDELMPTVNARQSINPSLSKRQILDDLTSSRYVRFDGSLFPGSKISATGAADVMIPKHLARSIELMNSNGFTKLSNLGDSKLTKAFRTSVLGLSPRWHVNNIVGGGIMVAARKPQALAMAMLEPGVVRGFLDDTSEAGVAAKRQAGIGTGIGIAPAELAPSKIAKALREAPRSAQLNAMFQFKGGQQIRQLWDQTQKAREVGGKVVEKSFEINGFVDDWYRAAVFLSEQKSALKKGLSEADSTARGVALTRKIFQQWDRMTPIERSLLRSALPFYGWVSHIMRYIVSYPIDHPVRAQIMSSVARNDLEDYGTAIPERFAGMFGLTAPDDQGDALFADFGAANPFGDMDSYFTLAGFMGQTNPLISTTLEELGVDTRTGTSQLYPDLYYDPELGRLAARPSGPTSFASNLLSNTIPQSQLLLNMSGLSDQWREIAANNPNAAGRILLGSVGIPNVVREVNINDEIIKAEIARSDAQDAAIKDALKTGDDSEARLFPGANAYLDQIRRLQADGGTSDFEGQTLPSFLDVVRSTVPGR